MFEGTPIVDNNFLSAVAGKKRTPEQQETRRKRHQRKRSKIRKSRKLRKGVQKK